MASKRKRLSVHDIDHSYNKSTDNNLSPIIQPSPSIITSSSSSTSSSVSSPLIPSLSPFLSPQLLMSPVMLVNGQSTSSDHHNPKASFKKRLLRKASTTSSSTALSEHSYHQDCRPITVPILEHSQKDDSKLLKNPRSKNGNVVIFDYSRPYVLTYSKQAKKLAKCLIANNDPEERQQPPPPQQVISSSSVMPNSTTKPAEECPPPIVKTEPLETETISKLPPPSSISNFDSTKTNDTNSKPLPPSLATSFENERRPQPPPSKPKKSVLEEEHSYHVSKSPPSTEQVTSSSAPETFGSMNSRCIRSTFIDPNHQHCHGRETSMDDNNNGFDEPPEDTTSLNAMDEAFGRYVISCLRGMSPAKRNQARIKIVKVLNQSI